MAIGITATTVIDNFRNLVNINSVSPGPAFKTGVGGAKAFSSPGTFIVGTDCPRSVTTIKVTGCGGGAPGDGGGVPGGGSGGGAATANVIYRTVSNGQTYNVTIGGAGGNTTVTLPGPVGVITCTAGGPSGSPGPVSPIATYRWLGNAAGPAGGNGGNGAINGYLSIMSGRTYGGDGGADGGAYNPGGNGTPAPSTTYGAGGGGGGGSTGNPLTPGSGGSGAPGYLIIEY